MQLYIHFRFIFHYDNMKLSMRKVKASVHTHIRRLLSNNDNSYATFYCLKVNGHSCDGNPRLKLEIKLHICKKQKFSKFLNIVMCATIGKTLEIARQMQCKNFPRFSHNIFSQQNHIFRIKNSHFRKRTYHQMIKLAHWNAFNLKCELCILWIDFHNKRVVEIDCTLRKYNCPVRNSITKRH